MHTCQELFSNITVAFVCSSLPGGAGGLVWFLLGLQKGRYKNNKYIAKCMIEITGAMITASFISCLIASDTYQPGIGIAFLVGVSWSGAIQMIRFKITKIVEVTLGQIAEEE